MVNERIVVEKKILKTVYKELRGRGYNQREIGEEIGSDFRNHLHKETSFSEESFSKLQQLYGRSIEHEKKEFLNGKGFRSLNSIDKDSDLAELVGVILGDGHLCERSYKTKERYVGNYYVDICLNKDETELTERVKNLLEKKFDKEAVVNEHNKHNSVFIRLYSKEVVNSLKKAGLRSGDKTENQVSVPPWIFEQEEFVVPCLRGLVDTDGSIYERKSGDIVVNFKNKSKPLLKDFKQLCSILNIETSSAGEDAVQIASQEDVQKFISRVEPLKARGF